MDWTTWVPIAPWTQGPTGWVTTVFWVAMLVWFGMAFSRVDREQRAFRRRLAVLDSILDEPGAGSVESRHMARHKARAGDPFVVGPLWQEFDETLVESPDGRKLSNTLDADHFFNNTSMAAGLTHNRVLSGAPAALTALGVLGTFVGLTMGLAGLHTTGALDTSDADALAAGIQTLIAAASVAFVTSVWGVGLSLIINIVEKRATGLVAGQIQALQAKVDRTYPRVTPELSLVHVADNTRESKAALQELHERIGDRLQETIQGLSSDMQSAVSGAITSALNPAMEKLVTTTTEQSQEVFGVLVDRFASSFTQIGTKQAEMLDQSSTRLNGAIDRVSAQFVELTQATADQHAELVARQAEILTTLDTLSAGISTSSTKLTEAAEHLTQVSGSIESAGDSLGSALTQTSATLMALYVRAVEQAGQVAELQKQANAIHTDLSVVGGSLSAAAGDLGRGLAELGESQRTFQSSIRTDVETTATALREHVSSLEKQVSKWLFDYSSDVENQIFDRMQIWNTQSQDYASTMLSMAKALANVVDEMSARQSDISAKQQAIEVMMVDAAKDFDMVDDLDQGYERAS